MFGDGLGGGRREADVLGDAVAAVARSPGSAEVAGSAVDILRRIGASGLLMQPTAGALANPRLRLHLDRYMRGRGIDAERKSRLLRLAGRGRRRCGRRGAGRQLRCEFGEPGRIDDGPAVREGRQEPFEVRTAGGPEPLRATLREWRDRLTARGLAMPAGAAALHAYLGEACLGESGPARS